MNLEFGAVCLLHIGFEGFQQGLFDEGGQAFAFAASQSFGFL